MKKIKLFYLVLLLLFFSGCSNVTDVLIFSNQNVLLEVGDIYDLSPQSNRLVTYQIQNEQIVSINGDVLTATAVGATNVTATAGIREVMILVTVKITPEENPPIIPPIEDDTPLKPLLATMSVHFIDVGQGDCIFIELPNRENLLIDAGKGLYGGANSWENISSTLQGLDVSIIDHLIITHNHSDHYDLVPNIIKDYEVLNVYGSGSTRTNSGYLAVINAILNASLEYNVVSVGDKIIDEEGLMLQVVATQKILNEIDPNITSVMTRLVFKEIAFMFTGDGGFSKPNDAEYIALASGLDLSANVLKVGHHGSGNSSSNNFLTAVGATYGVITTAEGSGTSHPHPDAMSRLNAHNITLYQTKDHGNIVFKTNGIKINQVETAR